ncbi:hypothetical protein C8J26_1632 [Sphingomonas aurantiaca]|jgi:hypothetical protein|uniref:Uncharacterized protein n=1 Tax=Sphingomonas aurantiaca TaxID=185949 RepID=A0A2T5GPP7_9SPHN|nr:hypothetical protein [Sphingomonas aurantiaca]PTQ61303.1 hypothetical protein C8J26_1632 [Sphingomonas aurantiaca]
MTGIRFDHYDWAGGREAMLRFGPDIGPIVLAALPLFEEANRTRQFACTILRALAGYGIGSVLPDFPGTGESLVATADATLSDKRRAYVALTQVLGVDTYALSIRSGALLEVDATLAGRWHLSPQSGEELVRDLERARVAAGKKEGDYAGNHLSFERLAALREAVPRGGGRCRIIRLDTDPRAADATYPGVPLWRRSEPDNNIQLAQKLAADIAHWIAA